MLREGDLGVNTCSLEVGEGQIRLSLGEAACLKLDPSLIPNMDNSCSSNHSQNQHSHKSNDASSTSLSTNYSVLMTRKGAIVCH
mmetsp:Transcript_4120/g.9885  ORF Transcript_4120/g.9885 Transcript_4120/m.9885 type:complete len:84 (+) Transcript_4120:320-571(+)